MAHNTAHSDWIDCHDLRRDEEAHRNRQGRTASGLTPGLGVISLAVARPVPLRLIEADGTETLVPLEDAAERREALEAAAAAEAKVKAEEQARIEAEARAAAEAQAKAEAEAAAKALAEEKARKAAEEKARKAAELKAQKEAEAKARAEAKAKREAELKAKKEAEAKARAEARAKREAELKAKKEAEARARAEAKAKAEAERKARAEAAAKAKREAEEKAKREAELKAKKAAEAKAKAEAEKKAKAEAAAKAKAEAERKAKAEAAAKAKREAEEKARKQAELKAKKAAEAKAKKEAEEKAKAEAKAKREAEKRAKQEAEKAAKAAEEKAKAEAAARKKAEQAAKAKAAKEAAAAEAAAAAEKKAAQEAALKAQDLGKTFRRLIRETGPISLAQYMAESNARYYASRDPLGEDADFITAPEVSQMFGELIGLWFADLWVRMGSRKHIHYVELGPGRGTLAKDALRTAARYEMDPQIHFVEGSPALRKIQNEAFPDATHHDDVSTLPDDAPLLIVANEFFDALPIHQLIRSAQGWHERMVGLEGDDLVFVAGDKPMDSIVPKSWAKASQGTMIETSAAASAVMGEIAQRLKEQGGAALIIDYGAMELRAGSTLQAIRAHEKVDPLSAPGEADLTAHVDFELLAQVAKNNGADVMGLEMQGDWLMSMGIDVRHEALLRKNPGDKDKLTRQFNRLVDDGQMGILFKVLGICGRRWPIGVGFSE